MGKGLSTVGLFVGGSLLSKMCHEGVALGAVLNLICLLGVAHVVELLGSVV